MLMNLFPTTQLPGWYPGTVTFRLHGADAERVELESATFMRVIARWP